MPPGDTRANIYSQYMSSIPVSPSEGMQRFHPFTIFACHRFSHPPPTPHALKTHPNYPPPFPPTLFPQCYPPPTPAVSRSHANPPSQLVKCRMQTQQGATKLYSGFVDCAIKSGAVHVCLGHISVNPAEREGRRFKVHPRLGLHIRPSCGAACYGISPATSTQVTRVSPHSMVSAG